MTDNGTVTDDRTVTDTEAVTDEGTVTNNQPAAADPNGKPEASGTAGEASQQHADTSGTGNGGEQRKPSADRNDTPNAPQSWRDVLPWEGKAQRADKLLLAGFGAVIAFGLAMTPVKPFLLLKYPIVLEFLTGSKVAIGAGAAFARIGEAPLWLVIVAGLFGMSKFDWLFWVCGRRWGQRVVKLFTPSEKAQRALAKMEHRPWLLRLAVVLSVVPGIPAGAVYAFAGWARMRLATFIICDLLSSAIMVGLITWLGFSIGQPAVDMVILIDKYAVWISVGLIMALSFWSGYRQSQAQKAKAKKSAADAPSSDDPTAR